VDEAPQGREERVNDLDDELVVRSCRPVKVALRRPSAPTSEPLVRSESWWMTAGRSDFTKRAEAERQRMSGDVIGRKVPDQILGRYIGLFRPQE
jgi:hypothetical protein